MPDLSSCPRCGATLTHTHPGGLCAVCLLGLGLDADVTRPGAGHPLDPALDYLPSLPEHYRLETRVGTGGMGIVYRAMDTRLNRPVAVKAVHDSRLLEPESSARFRAEALAAASLDHPYICKVYELIESGRRTLLVMEFVEGETLASILREERPPLDRAVGILAEIAEGLANAHAVGLVHRDIKPSNVMVTPHGHVKLLDFGLARPATAGESATTRPAGAEGDARAGTPHYMAPEQAEGQPVTARADIFSLGVVAFEAITGELPFRGSSEYTYVHSMLHDEPRSIAELAPGTPKDLSALVYRCLAKDPALRPESALAVARELRRISETSVVPTEQALRSASLRRSRNRWARIAIASLLTAASVAAAVMVWWPASTPVLELRQTALVTWPSNEQGSRISPDGRWVSFLTDRDEAAALYVQPVDGDARRVALPPGEIISHVWSPDGTKFACVLRFQNRALLVVVPAPEGGRAIQSLEIPTRPGIRLLRWVRDIVYLQTQESKGEGASGGFTMLRRLHLAGGITEEVSTAWSAPITDGVFREFDVAPDGAHVTFILETRQRRDLWIAGMDGAGARQLTNDEYIERRPLWSGPQAIVFQTNRAGQFDLWEASTIDGGILQLTSTPTTQELPESVTPDGSIITFQQVFENADLWVWNQKDGGGQLNAEASSDLAATLSADGQTVVFQRSRSTSSPLTLLDTDLVSGTLEGRNLTVAGQVLGNGFGAQLSPDGSHVAYFQRASSTNQLSSLKIKNLKTGQVVTVSDGCPLPGLTLFPYDWTTQNLAWTADSRQLIYVEREPGPAIRRYRLGSGREEMPLADTAAHDDRIRDLFTSSDGEWLAYLRWRAESSQHEVHLLNLTTMRHELLLKLKSRSYYAVSLKGWTERDRSVVLVKCDPCDSQLGRIDIQAVDTAGRARPIAVVSSVFDATIRIDPRRGQLYMTRSDQDVQNLYTLTLASGNLRRITDNLAPNVSFFGVGVLPDSSILFSRGVRVQDLWLARRAGAQK